MKNSLILFVFSLYYFPVMAQKEVVRPLIYNTQLIESTKNTLSRQSFSNLTLPFFDDFSRYSGTPNPSLWEDKDAFINRTYAKNPINLGVATLDGLDSIGFPRNPVESSHGPADYLTSRQIDLSVYQTIYFSFFVQAAGFGNEPEENDFLELHFLDSSLVWQTVWDTVGYPLSDFQKVNITLTDPSFLHDKFKLRFHNRATLSGNFDHWNIDQVLLTQDEDLHNENDDISFVYETSQMLNFYTAIPWSHFDNNRLAYMSQNMESLLRNNYTTTQSVDYRYDIYDSDNNLVYHYPTTGPTRNDEIPSFDGQNFSYSFDSPSAITVGVNAFPTSVNSLEKNSYTIVQSVATDDIDLFKQNDSLFYVQSFDNFYALDDGSAEASYGINAEGGQVAMLFNIGQLDTLKAVQFHFEQNYEDNNASAFSICLWDSDNGTPDNLIYQSQVVYPEYENSKNGFFEYILDNPIAVSGAVFVGWNQYYDNILNVGLDKNTINNDRMFYNLGSSWNISSCADCAGSWMIRPVFGTLTVSDVNENQRLNSYIYPNPTYQFFQINHHQPFDLTIQNLSGQLLLSKTFHPNSKIDISSFLPGLYIVKINSLSGMRIEKLIVQ